MPSTLACSSASLGSGTNGQEAAAPCTGTVYVFYIIDNYLLSLRDASMFLLCSSCFLKSVGLSHQTFQE